MNKVFVTLLIVSTGYSIVDLLFVEIQTQNFLFFSSGQSGENRLISIPNLGMNKCNAVNKSVSFSFVLLHFYRPSPEVDF